MKYSSLLVILLVSPATAFAQNSFAHKGLAFAQIAVGGGLETVLNATNRGASSYSGTLTLIPSDTTKPFPLLVNGNVAPGGTLSLALTPGATTSLRITSGDESLGILSGFATITDQDPNTTSLLEGNLTYYVKSADGTIVDSVGVAPSTELFQTVIPFDDFGTVALALANRNAGSQTATVTLTLFDETNTQAGTATQPLVNNQQVAKFLFQYFPGVSLTKGRVEIRSDHLFFGTALTYVRGGQASSLPFLASMKVYDFTIVVAGQTLSGELYVAISGSNVTVYSRDVSGKNTGLSHESGLLKDGNLEVFTHDGRGTSSELIFYGLIAGYNPLLSTQTGSVVVYLVNPPSVAGVGTVTLTALN